VKRIVALDPGGTTGWAYWQDQPNPQNPSQPNFMVGQLGPQEHHQGLYQWLEHLHVSDFTVVCESFEFRQQDVGTRMGINLMSREYIGVTKLFGQERNAPVVFQTAALGKGFVTDEKLKVMGLWWPGMKHAMDAMRHLIYYMVLKDGHKYLINSWKDLL
jgi:hypothetical protein